MNAPIFPSPSPAGLPRRSFLKLSGIAGAGFLGSKLVQADGETSATLPFENGDRPLVAYPQKRPLIRLTTRPPQLETPFAVFDENVLTPNDAFFVRYHLTLSPPAMDTLTPEVFSLTVSGKVRQPLKLSMADLKSQFEPVEVVAVNQCSGNGRGFSNPRVPGGQSANGAMGNARWRGVRLKDLLQKAGVEAGARQVQCNGLDKPLTPQTPDYLKSLDLDHALDGQVMLAYAMNGEDLPWLNGYPLRLVVPGYYGTYWIKHLHEIIVLDRVDDSYWMSTAYRIPDNSCACVEPGTTPARTTPISRLNVRSFITNLSQGARVRRGEEQMVRGIAFDGGHGIREVLFSEDAGITWRQAVLGRDLGKYSFREWSVSFKPGRSGAFKLQAKATNRIGQSQPAEPLWNPAGYMRNVVEQVEVNAL